MATLAQIWRHPIKSHGRESVAQAILEPGKAMPWDRVWAVAHTESQVSGAQWAPCGNFSRGSKAPDLSAITAKLDEPSQRITLSHPDRAPLTFDPDTEGEKLLDWTKGMIPDTRAQSARIVRAQTQHFTDSDFPSITLCNFSSHRAVEQRMGADLSIHRWRGNFWIDGLGPWEEFEWMDREVQIGEAVLVPRERTDRCVATHNNPETGKRDVNVLRALEHWGHQDFSVRAEVVKGGKVAVGDTVRAL